jgi:hypothetical protein
MRRPTLLFALALSSLVCGGCTLNDHDGNNSQVALGTSFPIEGWTTLSIDARSLGQLSISGGPEQSFEITTILQEDGAQKSVPGAPAPDAPIDLHQVDGTTLMLSAGASEPKQIEQTLLDLPDDRALTITGDSVDASIGGMAAAVALTVSDISLDVDTTGPLTVDCDSGRVAATAGGGSVHANAATVDFSWLGTSSLSIDQADGDLSIAVPDGVGFQIDATSDLGEVDLSVGTTQYVGGSYKAAIAGGGPLTLTLHSTRGRIVVGPGAPSPKGK